MPATSIVPARKRKHRRPGMSAKDILVMLYPREPLQHPFRYPGRRTVLALLPGLHLDAPPPQPRAPRAVRAGIRRLARQRALPVVVSELNHQLEEWRDFLPVAFNFSLDARETATECGGFLRQRYLTCRSVIYRPYLTWVLQLTSCADTMTLTPPENVLSSCKACLDACLLHIINLRGFSHTVLVDTWICSLSMTAAMLVLLAASRIPVLRQLVGDEVLTAATHLKQLIETWNDIPGQPNSPSIDQSLRLIEEIDGFIQQEYQGEEGYHLVQRISGC
ncbi:hypothetical protein LCER1_G004789 [Lachnellula cervina]|uniref:Uncharacterized protein n=1 Tax=Lachnellula cervina TaxID=1316786 RepID=A0A7D8YXR5_9HELO|nr:hypothetical protein LCER1_G004789 [Lachnellula cervina]